MANGFFGARGRDRINKFVQGKALPDPETLATLAKALGVPEIELTPTMTGTALEREYPELRVTQIANHRDLVHLTMDTVISLDALHAILTIYKDAKTRGATEAEHRTHGDPYASLTPEQWEAVQVLLAVDRAETRATRESIDTPEAQEKAPPKRRGRPPRAAQRLLRETA
jgi:transcriptional regulator with XRE-family HTH domain